MNSGTEQRTDGLASVEAKWAAFSFVDDHCSMIKTNIGKIIWVDDTVLAVFDQAIEIADVFGAREVSLEHLIYAMTQFETISDALYELNIHVSSLKEETWAVVLEQSSTEKSFGKRSPPKSRELEEALNHAAELAYARRSPVATEDIIDTLFDMSRNQTNKPLHRQRPEFALRNPAISNGGRPSFSDVRQKVRVSAGSNHLGNGSHHVSNGVPSVTDLNQNARMDDIDRALRDLTEDMARNRSAFGALIDELRGPDEYRQWSTNGERSNHETEDVSYVLGRLESSVEGKFSELVRVWALLGERLGAVERTIDGLETGNDGHFDDARFVKVETLMSALPKQLAEMERRLQQLSSDSSGSFDMDRMLTKLDSVEKLMRESPSGGSFELAPVMSSLRDVEAGLRGVGGQLREVDSRTGDVNLIVDAMSDRQKRLEDLIEAQQTQINEMTKAMSDGFGSVVVGSGDGVDISSSVNAVMSERFTGLSNQMQHRMGQLEDLVKGALDRPAVVNAGEPADNGYLNDAVGKIINNQHTLAGSIDEWRSQSREDIAAIKSRMNTFENKPAVAAAVPDDRFNEISDRLKHIQQTIPARGAQQLDGWTRFKMWLFGTDDWYGVSWDAREDDSTWVRSQQNQQQSSERQRTATPAFEPNYDPSAYNNQRA